MVHVGKSSACRFLSQGHKFTLQLESVLNPDVFSLSCGTDSIRLSYVRHASSILKLIRYMYDLWPYEWSLNGEIMWLSRRSSCECGRSLGLSHQKIWRISNSGSERRDGKSAIFFYLALADDCIIWGDTQPRALFLSLPPTTFIRQSIWATSFLPTLQRQIHSFLIKVD